MYGTVAAEAPRKPLVAGGRNFSAGNVFLIAGVVLLSICSIVPIWNSFSLLNNPNYRFWVGSWTPWWIILGCLSIIVLYAASVKSFFARTAPQLQTEQTVMMLATTFFTLMGLMLFFLSLPLLRQSSDAYTNLMTRCTLSPDTHRVYEYWQVLSNIRQLPDCAKQVSVENCNGYQDAKPYTSYLKGLENNYYCSGFCVGMEAKPASADTSKAPSASLLELNTTFAASREAVAAQDPTFVFSYPPTLFSKDNYQASCEGMAARDLRNGAGVVGSQTFWQGTYMMLISIVAGAVRLLGLCVRTDKDFGQMTAKARV